MTTQCQTPSGTNLLGLLKHCAAVELGYFGSTFDRPAVNLPVPWDDDNNADMYAAQHESMESVVAHAHADATIEALDLGTEGSVAWWPEDVRRCTLEQSSSTSPSTKPATPATPATPTSSASSSTG